MAVKWNAGRLTIFLLYLIKIRNWKVPYLLEKEPRRLLNFSRLKCGAHFLRSIFNKEIFSFNLSVYFLSVQKFYSN